MKTNLEKVAAQLENLALETVMLDAGDIPALGGVLQTLEKMASALGKKSKDRALRPVLPLLMAHVEAVIMGEASDLAPLETAVARLQEVCRKLARNESVDGEIAGIVALFHEPPRPASPGESPAADAAGAGAPAAAADAHRPAAPDESVDIGEEDKTIIVDFASESLDNLGTIEVTVMDLEQDPSDLDAINAIFRPFHTVKGVSGFLNFTRINSLSHSVENLLDKARNKELPVTEEMVDIVLASVDLLRQMIEEVQSRYAERPLEEGGIDIRPLMQRVESYIGAYDAAGRKQLGEMLVMKGAVDLEDIEDALLEQQKDRSRRIGEILVEKKKAAPSDVVSALRDQRRAGQQAMLHVKVDTAKLDNVVDMVGELAIAQSMLRQSELLKNSTDRKICQVTNQLNIIISSLQKTAMSLRMVPIKHTFQKMVRLVRDLAKKAGKQVSLQMTGEDTEIDRNMVEEIYEPMVHMIRNAVDHGLEAPEERTAAGKPGQGAIHLRAYHKGGDIVIEIEDDGRGLNRDKILKKAVAGGLIKETDALTDAEIHQLIFAPGFSTADTVTDISGRGVGTDVVKSRIEKLRGRVEVRSTPGRGSRFIMRLPLTLAIVDGMIVKVDGERYILPTLTVQEFFQPQQDECFTVKGEGEMIRVREDLIPLIRLNDLARYGGNGHKTSADGHPWEKLVVVVENQDKRKCLLVDELVGQEEVVIKSLGQWLKHVRGVTGGAILGDGRVGLILDISGVFDLYAEG